MATDTMINELRNKCVPSVWTKPEVLYQEDADTLEALLTDVVHHGRSTSILISGPRNSGKTTLIEGVIDKLSAQPEFKSCQVVRLSGVLCKEFSASLEELSYQLQFEDELSNFIEKVGIAEGRTEILTFLREKLLADSRPIFIILDNIELFCEQRGQALLYNLFDITHNHEKPICVIGVTSCQEILDLFEKRVKSRFSHRIIYIKPLKFEDYEKFALALVQLDNCTAWNKAMKKLLKENSVVRVLQQLYNTDSSIGTLTRFWYNVCLHCENDSDMKHELIYELYEETVQGSKVQQCTDLNLCELLFLLGVFKTIKSGLPTFTFQNIYETIAKAGEAKGITEADLRMAMKNIEELHLITPADKSCVYYKSELDHQELSDVSTICKFPAEFQGLL